MVDAIALPVGEQGTLIIQEAMGPGSESMLVGIAELLSEVTVELTLRLETVEPSVADEAAIVAIAAREKSRVSSGVGDTIEATSEMSTLITKACGAAKVAVRIIELAALDVAFKAWKPTDRMLM